MTMNCVTQTSASSSPGCLGKPPAAAARGICVTPAPPAPGELLPRAAEAFGVRVKLETYSLDIAHKDGGPKAKGFKRILGITIEDIGYLEGAIHTRASSSCRSAPSATTRLGG
jgi:hypothetical protein